MKHVPYCVSVLLILLPACSDDNGAKPTPEDATPPARVQDLAVKNSTGGVVTLSWTAPGDDGAEGQAARYEIRYSETPLAEAGWDSATVVVSPPVPKPAGQVESFAVSELSDGTWHFGLKAADEVPNWSALSNVVSATLVDTVPDTIPPDRVTDLAAVPATTTSVTLTWTAPGDDGTEGRASEYDLRYALASITEETWDDAVRVEGVPAPGSAGTEESFTITGLEPGTTYFFALRAADEKANWSKLSNVVSALTLSLVRLTYSPSRLGALRPDWSPDGHSIAFDADWEPRPDYRRNQLYLIPANGGEPVKLTNIPEGAFAPSWSPDGKRLAFISLREVYPATWQELSIMDPVPGAEPVVLASHGEQPVGDHAWSPDGSRIAYMVRISQRPLVDEIRIVPSTGGPSELLLTEDSRIAGLDWSPDGSQIAFSSDRGGNFDIWVVPVSGGAPVQLTNDPATDFGPEWSPDGSLIAFVSNRAGNDDIWLMSSTGEDQTQVSFDAAAQGGLSWAPDGSRIAFYSYRNEIYDIWVLSLGMTVAGGGVYGH